MLPSPDDVLSNTGFHLPAKLPVVLAYEPCAVRKLDKLPDLLIKPMQRIPRDAETIAHSLLILPRCPQLHAHSHQSRALIAPILLRKLAAEDEELDCCRVEGLWSRERPNAEELPPIACKQSEASTFIREVRGLVSVSSPASGSHRLEELEIVRLHQNRIGYDRARCGEFPTGAWAVALTGENVS